MLSIVLGIYACIVTIVIIVLAIRYAKHESKYMSEQNRHLDAQVKEINELYMTMRGWRHDYHNHMQKIKAHISLNQLDEAEEYINQMENELDSIDIAYKSGNINIDAILNSKLSLAERRGINVKCDAIVPEKLSVKDIDLCVIVGNLIDNAIEACDAMKAEDSRFVRIYMCVLKNELYISVTNSTSEVIRKLDKEYITNKRGNHGHGLRRISDAVKKYNGYINRKNEPGAFATEIMLPL